MISMLLSPRDDEGCFTERSTAAERRANYATGQCNNFGCAAIRSIELFAGGKGPVIAAVADHDQRLTAFELRRRCIISGKYAEMHTDAVAAVCI